MKSKVERKIKITTIIKNAIVVKSDLKMSLKLKTTTNKSVSIKKILLLEEL